MTIRDKIAEIIGDIRMSANDAPISYHELNTTLADAVLAALPHVTSETIWRRNLRDSFDAMCAMRNDINNVVPMPSLESDLLQGPETSVFCSEVAFAIIENARGQALRIADLEKRLAALGGDL